VDELLLRGRPDVLADGLQPHLDGVFLQEIPLEVLRQGRANGVALMAGAMADEVLPAFLVNPSTLEYRFLPWERFWERLTELFGAERVSALKALYPQEGYSDPLSLWEDIIGDVMLRCPTEIALRAQSQGEPRTFHYHFTWNLTFGRPDLLGAFHGYDLAFVFGVFEAWDGIFGDALSRAIELREAVQRYWVRFAEKGDPNGPPDPPWLPYREGKTQLLGESILSVENPLRGRCAYWEPYLPTGIDQLTQGIWDLGGR
jgi:para-nitrobenzyl esterase